MIDILMLPLYTFFLYSFKHITFFTINFIVKYIFIILYTFKTFNSKIYFHNFTIKSFESIYI